MKGASVKFIGQNALEYFDDIAKDILLDIWDEQYKGVSPFYLKHDFFRALEERLKEIDEKNFPLFDSQERVELYAKEIVSETILAVLRSK